MENSNRKLPDLRNHLFDQLERLKDAKDPATEIHRAEAMSHLAGQIINSVKVQLQFIKTVRGNEGDLPLKDQTSDFFGEPAKGLSTGKQLGTVSTMRAVAK